MIPFIRIIIFLILTDILFIDPRRLGSNDRMLVQRTHMLLYNVYNNLQIYHIIWSWLLKVKKKMKIKVKNKAWNWKRCALKEWDRSTFELHFLASQKKQHGNMWCCCHQPFVVKKSSSNSSSSTNHQKQSQCLVLSPLAHSHTHFLLRT